MNERSWASHHTVDFDYTQQYSFLNLTWNSLLERSGTRKERVYKSNKQGVQIYELNIHKPLYGEVLDNLWYKSYLENEEYGSFMEDVITRLENENLRYLFFAGTPGSGKTTALEELVDYWTTQHPSRPVTVITWEKALYSYLDSKGVGQSHNKSMTRDEWKRVEEIFIQMYEQAKIDVADKNGIVLGECVGVNFIDQFQDDIFLRHVQEKDPDISLIAVISSDLRMVVSEAFFRQEVKSMVQPELMNQLELEEAYKRVVDRVQRRYLVTILPESDKAAKGKEIWQYYTRVAGMETMMWVYSELWNKVISWAEQESETAYRLMEVVGLNPISLKEGWRRNELEMQKLYKAYLFYTMYLEYDLKPKNILIIDNMMLRQKLRKRFNIRVDE